MHTDIETEVRFLEVDVKNLKKRLAELQATDHGEDLLKEVIFYDQHGAWQNDKNKMVRVRSTRDRCYLTYKHNIANHSTGTREIEIEVNDFEKTRSFLKEVGLVEYRQQEKYRHKYTLEGITIDIDQWPKIPAYVELEGDSEAEIQSLALRLNLDWSSANTHNAAWVIENVYKIPVMRMRYFTFDKVE